MKHSTLFSLLVAIVLNLSSLSLYSAQSYDQIFRKAQGCYIKIENTFAAELGLLKKSQRCGDYVESLEIRGRIITHVTQRNNWQHPLYVFHSIIENSIKEIDVNIRNIQNLISNKSPDTAHNKLIEIHNKLHALRNDILEIDSIICTDEYAAEKSIVIYRKRVLTTARSLWALGVIYMVYRTWYEYEKYRNKYAA